MLNIETNWETRCLVAEDRVVQLETRRDELLATIVRLTNEVPFPDEVNGWVAQRAAMLAEIGTLRARVRELEQKVEGES